MSVKGILAKNGNGLSQNVEDVSSVTGASSATCHAITVTVKDVWRLALDLTSHSHGPGEPPSINNRVYTEQITVSLGRESTNEIDVVTYTVEFTLVTSVGIAMPTDIATVLKASTIGDGAVETTSRSARSTLFGVLGALVGLLVVGAGVGAFVGGCVGTCVGFGVGDWVGLCVGTCVGFRVGESVGLVVGLLLGAWLGA